MYDKKMYISRILTVENLWSFIAVWYPERHRGYCYRECYIEVFVSFAQVHANLKHDYCIEMNCK
jgi:hypothetical protein